MARLLVPFDGWTFDTLPDEPDLRCELVDGCLLVNPPARPRHSSVASRLGRRLAAAVSAEWEVMSDAGIYFDDRNYRVPDVVVCRRSALDDDRLRAGDVLLAVEVMSPGSIASDRVAKPVQYAEAGIPYFWRIEPDVLLRHALDGRVYREVARCRDEVAVEVEEPVALAFHLADLWT